ncbi:hypothetical protein Trco_001474 [Trichoderma cornu-damae]|uniref:Transmembrane protein n=1 Tax=Trichoderma cornu-damae TaxID=654480 RepID=A0A9P8U1A2_9HYPO|nr:hypothetical protein Trco_001474 [Trichoderma cornu-damae]
MFFGGYFIRSASPLPNPFFAFPSIFSRPPPSSFPFLHSSLASTANFFRDALAVFQCFWPLFFIMFCISLVTSLVQQYIFAFLSFSLRKLAQSSAWLFPPLWRRTMSAVDAVLRRLPFNFNALSKNKKRASAIAGTQRSPSRGAIR